MADEPTADAEVIAESEPVQTPETEVVERAPSEDVPTNDPPVEDAAPEPNAVDEEPAPVGDEQPTEPELPDLTGLSIAQIRERAPELAQSLEYAGAQARESELRQKQGSEAATAERLKSIKERLRANPDAEVDADLGFLDQNNLANAAQRHMGQLTEGWNKLFEPTAEERERITAAATTGNLNKLAAVTMETAARSIGLKAAFELDASEIPPDSKLGKSIRARDTQRDTSEAKAAEIKASGGNGVLPQASAGGPVNPVSTDTDLERLNPGGPGIPMTDVAARKRVIEKLGLA